MLTIAPRRPMPTQRSSSATPRSMSSVVIMATPNSRFGAPEQCSANQSLKARMQA